MRNVGFVRKRLKGNEIQIIIIPTYEAYYLAGMMTRFLAPAIIRLAQDVDPKQSVSGLDDRIFLWIVLVQRLKLLGIEFHQNAQDLYVL